MIKQQSLVLAAALGAALFSNATQAGECPADKISVDATKPAANPAKGVTDTVLSAIDLSQEPTAIDGRKLRLRKLVVQPGGVVPWHSHGDRPAIIYILEGTITDTPAIARCRSCTKRARSRAKRALPRIGGKTLAARPQRSSPLMSSTMRAITICDRFGRGHPSIWRPPLPKRGAKSPLLS